MAARPGSKRASTRQGKTNVAHYCTVAARTGSCPGQLRRSHILSLPVAWTPTHDCTPGHLAACPSAPRDRAAVTRCGHGPCLPLSLRERIGDSAVPELDPMPLRLRVSGSRLHHHALLPLAGALPAAISATLQHVRGVQFGQRKGGRPNRFTCTVCDRK